MAKKLIRLFMAIWFLVYVQSIYAFPYVSGGASGSGGTGAPTDAQYYVGTANGDLSAEIVPAENVISILGAADYAAIRTLLALTIGTNFQAYDSDLDYLSGFTPSTDVKSVLTAASSAAIKTALGLVIGTNIQAYDADLTTYAGIPPSANAQTLLGETFAQMQASLSIDDLITLSGVTEGSTHLGTFTGVTISDSQTVKQALQALETAVEAASGAPASAHYFTDQAEAGLSAEVVVSADGKSLITAADSAAMRTFLSLVIGTNVQAYDSDLAYLSGFTPSDNVKTVLNAADNAAIKSALGYLTSGDLTQASIHVDDILTALGIVSEATHFGTFTGVTIADNSTAKAALQALETAVELKQTGHASLTSIAGLTETAGGFPYFTADNVWAVKAACTDGYLLTWASGVPSCTNSLTGLTFGGFTASYGVESDASGNLVSVVTTGTGSTVRSTSPTLITPILGSATATTINKVTITAPDTAATLTLITGSSLITAGAYALTLTSTQASNATIPPGTNDLLGKSTGSVTTNQLTKFSGTTGKITTNSTIVEDGTDINAQALNFISTGIITGKIGVISKSSAYTIGTDAAREAYGYLILATTSTTVITLPTIAAIGMSGCVYATETGPMSVDVPVTDHWVLNGTALAAGNKATATSAAGNFIFFVYGATSTWYSLGVHGTWADGG